MRAHLLLGYSLLTAAWLVAWAALGDTVWWLALLNHVAAWAFLPLPALLALACLPGGRQSARARLLRLLPALLVAGLALGPLLIPRPPPVATGRPLRVMTFNVLFSNPAPEALVRAIRAADADVLALQEVTPELMEALARELRATHPHALIAPEHPYGSPAIFSRAPFVRTQILDLEADRQAALVEIEHDGRPVVIVSAHLLSYGLLWVPWPDIPRTVEQRVAEQQRQAHRILASLPADPGAAAIVACDCNSPETAGTSRILHAALQSSARVAGWSWAGLARPGALPDLAPTHIDYLFFRGPLRPVAHYRLADQGGSDHHPVVAELR